MIYTGQTRDWTEIATNNREETSMSRDLHRSGRGLDRGLVERQDKGLDERQDGVHDEP